jgi:cellulose synthase/poly-beta-1,6-N-acetylglucosamine synthase-like glycosyltransferase
MPNIWLLAAFFGGIAGTLYAYALFPVFAALLSRMARKPADAPAALATPVVTVVIPAYNEERNIAQRITNILASDYPRDLLEVIVVSDASSDSTNEIVRGFAGVRLIEQRTRQGKSAGLNRAMDVATGEVVVFTDANAVYQTDTIRLLLRHFHSARVGLVSGYTRYVRGQGGEVASASNLHTGLERAIKRAESAFGCCMGADGAVFAMRRSLYRPLRNDDINDFTLPLTVLEQGFQCLLDEEAICIENAAVSLESEFQRQSRITNRTLRALWRRVGLMNPIRRPRFAFFLFSHKVVRFLVPVFLVISAVSFLLLVPPQLVALLGAGTAAAVLLTRVFGPGGSDRKSREWPLPIRIVNVFVVVNCAVLHGWGKFLSGRHDVVWQHDRSNA